MAAENSLRAMKMSPRISAASRGDIDERGETDAAGGLLLTFVGVSCARMETARHRTSGTATRVSRLIALLLFPRVTEPTVVVSGCPQASYWNQRYQKSCPEAPFSFATHRPRQGAAGGSRHSEDWRRNWAAEAKGYCCPCRKDARANWRARRRNGRHREAHTFAWARCRRRNTPGPSAGMRTWRAVRTAGQLFLAARRVADRNPRSSCTVAKLPR